MQITLKAKALTITNKYVAIIGGVLVFGVIGTVTLFSSHAATPTASIEPESGTISSAASSITDSSASNSNAVKFGSSSSTATQTNNCAVPYAQQDTNTHSHLCGFPDLTNTGVPAGTSLTNVPSQATSGSGWTYNGYGIVVTADSTVISGLNISGGISICANNVTVKNTKVTATATSNSPPLIAIGYSCNNDSDGLNAVIQDTTIIANQYMNSCIGAGGYTATRVICTASADGFKTDSARNTTIQDSLMYGIVGDHGDGIQDDNREGGTGTKTIRHNTIYGLDTCILLSPPIGIAESNVLITNNLFDNNGGLCVRLSGNGTNRVVSNNRFAEGSVCNVTTGSSSTITYSNNVQDASGAPEPSCS